MKYNTHQAIVKDAILYMAANGTENERRALTDLIHGYGNEKVFALMQETADVDKYQDLALYTDYCKSDIGNITYAQTEVGPLNHFVNGFGYETNWKGPAKGYSYTVTPDESAIDDDADGRIAGYSDDYDVVVDRQNSACLNRLHAYWKDQNTWNTNWQQELNKLEFVPGNLLAEYYYRNLLLHHHIPLQVSHPGTQVRKDACGLPDTSSIGETKFISELEFLAPVLHMVADACVPHHVRGVSGCRHQSWEGHMETYSEGNIYQPEMVKNIIEQLCRGKNYVINLSNHIYFNQLKDRFDVSEFIYYVSRSTIHRIMVSTGVGSRGDGTLDRSQLAAKPASWWRDYVIISGSNSGSDIEYFYNQAVAASVITLRRACEDLVAVGVISGSASFNSGFNFSRDMLKFKRIKEQSAKIFHETEVMDSGLRNVLRQVDEAMRLPVMHLSFKKEYGKTLEVLENYLVNRFLRGMDEHGAKFCPLRINLKQYFENWDPFWGIFTYRNPLPEEISNKELYKKYVDGEGEHLYKAGLLWLSFYKACARFAVVRAERMEKLPAPKLLKLVKDMELRQKTSIETGKTMKPGYTRKVSGLKEMIENE